MYLPSELQRIVARSAKTLGIAIEESGSYEIARRSRGTPRIANRLLKRVRDFTAVSGGTAVTRESARAALARMEIDELGLDETDRGYLRALIEKFRGGPAGLETLAATVNEDVNTIEDVYEPYLLQLGFIAARRAAASASRAATSTWASRPPRGQRESRCLSSRTISSCSAPAS